MVRGSRLVTVITTDVQYTYTLALVSARIIQHFENAICSGEVGGGGAEI